MAQTEQLSPGRLEFDGPFVGDQADGSFVGERVLARDARETLRAQVGKLERELSRLIATGFPHISPLDPAGERFSGPRLLTLGELERQRDRLASRLSEIRDQVAQRTAFERRSHELLERMRLEPARYKYARVPVADLGVGHCGVWEVRPRLGLVGMLAGWWEVKLSSGCP